MAETVAAEGEYVIETCDDQGAWDGYVERNDGPAFVHSGWSDAVSTYGHDYWPLVARHRDSGAIAGVLPLYHVKSRLFGSQLLSPAFAERGSVVLDEEDETNEVADLLLSQTKAIAESRSVDAVSLRGSRVEPSSNFSVENRYVTFQIPVGEGEDPVWSGIKDSRQRQITQAAEDELLRFRVGNSLEDLREYYRLYLETMRGHGSPPHSFAFFETLWERLYHEGKFRLGMITHDGSLINGMIDLSLGSTVYQWGVVSDYEHRDRNGGSLLLWKSLEWAAEHGYRTYEFGRTREGSGVYLFKKSFGGSKEWYDDLHYFPKGGGGLPDPDDDKYDRATEIWRRLPLSITRTVGPKIRKRIGI